MGGEDNKTMTYFTLQIISEEGSEFLSSQAASCWKRTGVFDSPGYIFVNPCYENSPLSM